MNYTTVGFEKLQIGGQLANPEVFATQGFAGGEPGIVGNAPDDTGAAGGGEALGAQVPRTAVERTCSGRWRSRRPSYQIQRRYTTIRNAIRVFQGKPFSANRSCLSWRDPGGNLGTPVSVV